MARFLTLHKFGTDEVLTINADTIHSVDAVPAVAAVQAQPARRAQLGRGAWPPPMMARPAVAAQDGREEGAMVHFTDPNALPIGVVETREQILEALNGDQDVEDPRRERKAEVAKKRAEFEAWSAQRKAEIEQMEDGSERQQALVELQAQTNEVNEDLDRAEQGETEKDRQARKRGASDDAERDAAYAEIDQLPEDQRDDARAKLDAKYEKRRKKRDAA